MRSINSDEQIINIAAANTQVIFRRSSSGESLDVVNLTADVLFRGRSGPVWKALIQDEHGCEREITSELCPHFEWEAAEFPTERCFTIQWRSDMLDARGTVILDKHSGLSYWKLNLKIKIRNWHVSWVEFPILRLHCDKTPQSIVIPEMAGLLILEPMRNLGTFRSSYPGNLTMQFMSFIAGPSGIYLACHDSEGYFKTLDATAENDSLGMSIRHEPSVEPGRGDYAIPYPVVIGSFQGDWQSAAVLYRDWASRQRWAKRREIPQWLKELDLWVWNRGASATVFPPAVELSKRLDSKIAVDWYWWHRCAYDTGFPEYFPPREGDERFWRVVEEAHEKGIRVQPYINGRLWGTMTRSWSDERAQLFACKNRDGKLYTEVYNPFNNAELAVMCPATEAWQQKIADVVEHLVCEYDVDGVYLDCIGIAPHRLCYDQSHGHPIGPGNYWAQGYRKMIEGIRKRLEERKHPVMLSTESCVEIYLDLFDAVLNIDAGLERYGWYENRFGENWQAIPLFAAVYHKSAVAFGSATPLVPKVPRDPLWNAPPAVIPPDLPSFKEEAFLELARNFLWGSQLLLANVTPEDFETPHAAEILEFLKELIELRRKYKEFLVDGTWMESPEITCDSIQIQCGVCWLYAQENAMRVTTRTVPAVLCSAWRDDSGHSALFLINITQEKRRITLKSGRTARELQVDPLSCIVFASDELSD